MARGNIVLWGVGGVEEGTAPPPPPPDKPGWRELRLGNTVRGPGFPPRRGTGGGGRWPHQSRAKAGAAHSGCPLGPVALDDGRVAAPPLPG